MGCENFATVFKSLSLLVVKRQDHHRTAGRQSRSPRFGWYRIGSASPTLIPC